MKNNEIRRLMGMMAKHGIAEFSYSDHEGSIDLAIELPLHPKITCPQAGVFVSALDGLPAATLPRKVRGGEILAYLKVGPVLVPVAATEDGWLPKPFPADGEIVGYGELLF